MVRLRLCWINKKTKHPRSSTMAMSRKSRASAQAASMAENDPNLLVRAADMHCM